MIEHLFHFNSSLRIDYEQSSYQVHCFSADVERELQVCGQDALEHFPGAFPFESVSYTHLTLPTTPYV